MKRYNKNLGDFGEKAAAEYLENTGYVILKCNYRTPFGEIDIIAKDGDVLVFVEVKTRSSVKYGLPSEAIDKNKREHLIKSAEEYLRKFPEDCEMRFDAIEVSANVSAGFMILSDINHIPNIDIV